MSYRECDIINLIVLDKCVSMSNLQVEYIEITKLKNWDKNPRKNDTAADKLTKLIEHYGFVNPVIVNRKTNVILAGHTRVKAAKKLNLDTVPVIFVDFDKAKANGFALADNKSSEWSQWDNDILKDVFADLKDLSFDLELTGFELPKIENFVLDIEKQFYEKEDEELYLLKHDPLNVNKGIYESNNNLGYPTIYKTNKLDIVDLIPFDRITVNAPNKKDFDKTIHFFLEDYKFNALWNNPLKYIKLLSRYKSLIMPDFSIYSDYPESLNIFQMYKRFWITRFLQECNIDVIPCVRWRKQETLEEDLKPIPKNSMIALSTVRLFSGQQEEGKQEFINSLPKVLDLLEPVKIIWYGKMIDDLKINVPIQQFNIFYNEKLKGKNSD